jgi:transposase
MNSSGQGELMCLHPELIPPVPEATVKIASSAFPKGNRYMRLRDELGVLYNDEEFAELYPDRGQSAIAPWRLVMILIMQFLENLSDRQAADAVRGRIDWKYALSLELEDDGFDFSVLSEFRDRLIEGGKEKQILDKMLSKFGDLGLLKSRGKARTDSTHILAALKELSRLEHLEETLKYALNTLADVAPSWLSSVLTLDWYDRYGQKVEHSKKTRTAAEKEAKAIAIGVDGFYLLDVLYAETTLASIRNLKVVEVLRQVWLQQYYAPRDGKIQLRTDKDGPPHSKRIFSPYEIEARKSTKRSTIWTGYKVHLTETCEEDLPHLITHVETTVATTQDPTVLPSIHQDLAEKKILPRQHLVDLGYTSAQLIASSQKDYQIDLFGPVALNGKWQAKEGIGFDMSHFRVNWKRKVVYCPQGKRSNVWKNSKDSYGKPVIRVEFRKSHCSACPVRSQCTRSKVHSRGLTLMVQEDYEALAFARQRQTTEEFKKQYALRSGIEGTISQGVRGFNLRQCRYLGLAKTYLQHILTAAAINLERIYAWLEEIPLAKTRVSHFQKLATQKLAIAL